MRVPIILVGLGLALGVALAAGSVQAQIDDHLKCYKIKDDIKLKGTVDLNSPKFGLEPGCKIGKAKLFCVPATKSNVQVQAKNDDGPVDPLPIFGPPAPGDRICYKVKCPGLPPPGTTASDQFGTHNMTRLRAFMLCTPAVPQLPCCPKCGDASCDGDETVCNCDSDCLDSCDGTCLFFVPVCGDGTCDLCAGPGESHESCPLDCPLNCQVCP